MRLWFYMLSPYLFIISPSFDVSGGLCFVCAIPGYIHIYFCVSRDNFVDHSNTVFLLLLHAVFEVKQLTMFLAMTTTHEFHVNTIDNT